MAMVRQVIGRHPVWSLRKDICDAPNALNMTRLALRFSRYINGVSAQHGQTSREMFGGYRIDAITNGVHAATWAAPPFQRLLDRHIPAWRTDNFSLRYALTLPEEQVWTAHTRCKTRLIEHINKTHGAAFDPDVFTIGFARRATAYKRADLVLHSVSRLKKIAAGAGAFQIVFAGKAHPRDEPGQALIRKIFKARHRLAPEVRIVYLPNYDIALAKVLIPGVDLWLNTPQPPHEASGTSGMKAALNAVPSLSVLDGWWTEGCVENLTGWAIGRHVKQRKGKKSGSAAAHAKALYDKLEKVILPMYYNDRSRYLRVMTSALALNGSFFNTQRMVREYLLKAYVQ
jgi:starch phosphorylase